MVAMALLVSLVILASLLTSTTRYGEGAVSFTADQIRYLTNFAKKAFVQPTSPTNLNTIPNPSQTPFTTPSHPTSPAQHGPKERSDYLNQHMRESCRALNVSLGVNDFMMAHMHYDDKRKAIYCFMPKVACTSWKRVWMKMIGIVPADKDLATIDRYRVHTSLPLLATNKDKAEKLRTYKKFMLVRHPFDRVLSAYKDKLEHEDRQSGYNFHREIGLKIELKYRGTATMGGHNVTFPEFIRFISEPGHGTFEQRNEHWLSVHEICNPCAIQYDFIGKYETLKEDAEYLLEWLGVKEIIGDFPSSDRPFHARRYDPKYFNQLGSAEKVAFFSKYLADFLALDYEFL